MKFYLCDQKQCELCNPECHHTDDIAHALHPDAPDEDFVSLPSWVEGEVNLFEKDGEVEIFAAEIEGKQYGKDERERAG